ncbi:hypothetical protein Mapa_015179 [Marchantia paleacea]|nr:hypothetical protein Mapa_015179 [Marchantia paleacea]
MTNMMVIIKSANRVVSGELFILVVMIIVCLMSEDVDASSRDLFRSPGIKIITAEEEIKSLKISELTTEIKTGSLRSRHLEFRQRYKRPLKEEQSTLRRLLAPQDSRRPPANQYPPPNV